MSVEPEPARILIVDDHPVLSLGINRLLSTDPVFDVVAVLASAEELSEYGEPWDVLVLDVNLSDASGLDVLERIASTYPDRRVVVYTVAKPEQVGLVAMNRGASAFISKDEEPDMLFQAVVHASRGEKFVTPKLAELMFSSGNLNTGLSDREAEVVQLLALGARPAEIADALHVARATISGHLARARNKLGANSNVELVKLFEGQSGS